MGLFAAGVEETLPQTPTQPTPAVSGQSSTAAAEAAHPTTRPNQTELESDDERFVRTLEELGRVYFPQIPPTPAVSGLVSTAAGEAALPTNPSNPTAFGAGSAA